MRVAAGRSRDYCENGVDDLAAVRAYHHLVKERWSTPLDEPVEPLELHDGLRGALERGLVAARDLGLVQVTEAGMDDWAYYEALLGLRARGPLPVRVRLLVASGIAEPKKLKRTGDPWLEVEGVKFYADGWLGSRTCAMCRPFHDEDDAGVLFLDADTLARRCDPYAEAGWTIATHAIGDRAVEAVLDAYEKVFGRDCPNAAPRVEHAQVLSDELIRRMASLGVVACINPGFAASDAADARKALGGDRWESSYRWDELLAAGVRVISGADFPIEPLSPLLGLQHLATAHFPLTIAQGLTVMTDASAGTTVLSDDPHRVAEDELAGIEVVEARPAG